MLQFINQKLPNAKCMIYWSIERHLAHIDRNTWLIDSHHPQCVCRYFFKTTYNKTVITFSFSDIRNNQGLDKCLRFWLIAFTSTLIFLESHKPQAIIAYNHKARLRKGTKLDNNYTFFLRKRKSELKDTL